ncbi:MAG: hypothetical protein SVR94_15480 [Pseudomonadota bacterium]|nr:hypothetical protein [Pseudomonadota bacterium]
MDKNPSNIKNVQKIARILKNQYGDFSHYNKKNPFNELLFIMCSTRTQENSYQNSYRRLRKEYPSNNNLENASENSVSHILSLGGLSNKKANYIIRIIKIIQKDFGHVTLSPLKKMSDIECEKYLCSLPGVGKKTARCVMMYSLGRRVFPVDQHCWRIALRLGWIKPKWNNNRISPGDEDKLQELIPESLRYSIHVNFISLGREFCYSRNPDCMSCPINKYCLKVGVVK